jgi:hypothetical protein
MPAFNDMFSTFAPTASGLNPPPTYETTHGLSYVVNQEPRYWFLESSLTMRYSRKSGFKIPTTGFVEVDFTFPAQSSSFVVFIGSETWQDHAGIVINTYSSQLIAYLGAGSAANWNFNSLPGNHMIRFRIERSGDTFTLSCSDLNGNIIGQHTGIKANVGDDVAIGQAETGYSIHRFQGQNEYPAPEPVLVLGRTKTSASLQCAAIWGALEYEWQYREAGSNLWLPGPTTNTNMATLTGLRPNKNYEARVRFGS